MRDKRLADYADYSQDSKYTGQYMVSSEWYNNAKPFVHLKLDQACRRTMPKDSGWYDYELGFTPESVTICLSLVNDEGITGVKFYNWLRAVSDYINSLALKEFNATEAFPEDEHLADLMKDLAFKLANTPPDSEGDSCRVSITSSYHE